LTASPAAKQRTSLGHTPSSARWAFDESVTDVFDDMLARSIPQYDVMRQAVTDIASAFVVEGAPILDLGTSRGEALAPLIERFGPRNRYVGIEVSPSMLAAARERFKDCGGWVTILEHDLRTGYPPVEPCVTLAVLTLQFTPIERRQRIVRDVYKHLRQSGAFVVVEKILGATADLDTLMVKQYYALKAANGYSQEEIDRKRLSLEGVLVPMTADWNVDLLRRAGFEQIDCIWRWQNFCAWVAMKD
jgi:tRNA (cmo5U34)-methyltransferase